MRRVPRGTGDVVRRVFGGVDGGLWPFIFRSEYFFVPPTLCWLEVVDSVGVGEG